MSKITWRDNIGRSNGPLASVYWCKLCGGKQFKVVVSSNRGQASSSKAMSEVQTHIKEAHSK